MTIEEIKSEIETQDNRATGQPYVILLQRLEKIPTPEAFHYDSESWLKHDTGDCTEYKSKDDFISDLADTGCSKAYTDNLWDKCEHIYWIHTWRTVNVFFTHKGYEKHMGLNGHNYKENEYRTYIIHCGRNPEMETVYNIILGKEQNQCPVI